MYKYIVPILLFWTSGICGNTDAQISRNAEKEDIRQISLILDKIERGVQQQRPDWIASTICYDSTKSSMNMEASLSNVNRNFDLLNTSVQNRSLKAEFPLLKNTGDFSLRLKKIDISPDQNTALVELEAGFAFAGEDSTYYLSLPFNTREKTSAKDKEHLLKYQPITLELLKIDHNWRVLNMDPFTEFIQKKAAFFSVSFKGEKAKSSSN